MHAKSKFAVLLPAALAFFLSACGARKSPKFVAPEIEPPADLIPAYVPEGFTLLQGFQLPGRLVDPDQSDGIVSRVMSNLHFNLKSPAGNDVLGVVFQGKNHSLLITKSYFPGGTLELWRDAFEGPSLDCECECPRFHPEDEPLLSRFPRVVEERTVGGTRVIILRWSIGWITVFLRGDFLLTVEGGLPNEQEGVSLEENLKVVESLLEGRT